ncbi:Crp/Fnr family transcriptional regulator [Mediterraneibacter agrestimuris]|uniref:Crp/Fnr family transcriptional regulator n=1 Tax=Mediterraneibacter agrestimuris TaxID=2941333 RepID=UPI00203F030A|nr:Crp/Fnr family transcriptional regulator [Mediterraneibacter agrestimuris]
MQRQDEKYDDRERGNTLNWETIGKARLFEQLTLERTQELFLSLKPKCMALKKGELFIRDGQKVSFFGILESGELNATKLYKDGSQSLMLKYEPSYMVGVDIAATKRRSSTYYITAVKDSQIYVVDYDKIAKPGYVEETERLLMMESVLALIAGENQQKMSKIEILSRKGMRDRILTFLAIQRSLEGKDEFDIPYNREEMAEFLCVNRSALSHELRLMEEENLIYCRKNHFRILEAELYNRE